MLNRILPTRKLPDADFQIVSPTREKNEDVTMEHNFSKLLDELQIPPSLRPKLAGMESSVKAAMLKSSATLTPRTVRKTKSSHSISSLPEHEPLDLAGKTSMDDYDLFQSPHRDTRHGRGASLDMKQAKKGKENTNITKWTKLLTATSSTQLDVESIKKLRLLLRNESASWTQDFLSAGGYSALLTRLNELLELEWREEQHDDKLLHELLRCLKALSTSSTGCAALCSHYPTPWVQLISLLYSDKKPGEVATRSLIVELILLLVDLFPTTRSSDTSRAPSRASRVHPSSPAPSSSALYPLMRSLFLTPPPPPSSPSPSHPPVPLTPHAFIEALHTPRIYKTYLQELSDVCRDYFWVFCHPGNGIWRLDEVDEARVERPRAPGGMTGGVEFEAMGYMTLHFKLLNAFVKAADELGMPQADELSAHRLHTDLFLSGFDRILAIARKASTTYYPTLHLEIARYINGALRSGFELPWAIAKLVNSPPAAVARTSHSTPIATSMSTREGRLGGPREKSGSRDTSPSKAGRPFPPGLSVQTQGQGKGGSGGELGSPVLPQPRKVTPLYLGS